MKQDANQILINGGPDRLRAQLAKAEKFQPNTDGTSTKPRFVLTRFKDIHWNASVAYLVDDLLPLKGNVLVYGPPKCGKSFWVYDVSMSIARGIQYRGRRVRKGPVLYFAAEGGEGFTKRVEGYRQNHDCKDEDFHLCTVRPSLAADAGEMISDIKRHLGENAKPALIVIDTVNRTIDGSENDSKDVAKYLRAQALLEDEFKCCVVLVHHCGLEAGRPRGHTSFTGAADVQIAIIKDGVGNVVATIELAKDGPSGDEIVSRLEPIEIGMDSSGKTVTSCIVVPVAGPSQKRSTKKKPAFSDQTELCRRALAHVLAEHGETNIHVPAGLKGVPESLWRKECYSRGIGGAETSSRNKAFNRAKASLAVKDIIGEKNGIAWIARVAEL